MLPIALRSGHGPSKENSNEVMEGLGDWNLSYIHSLSPTEGGVWMEQRLEISGPDTVDPFDLLSQFSYILKV